MTQKTTNWITTYSGQTAQPKKFQAGGPMDAAPAAAPAPEAGAPDIEGMLMEYAQTRDPQLAVAICDTLIEMMAGQGAPAGEPGMAPPMARSGMKMSKAPIFKK